MIADPLVHRADTAPALEAYRSAGSRQGPPLLLDIGEPARAGAGPSATLLEHHRQHAATGAGYYDQPAGLPYARASVRAYLEADHHLTGFADHAYAVGITAVGTRAAIHHHARLTAARTTGPGTPRALVAAPCWDYHGPLAAAGLTPLYWPLLAENRWSPRIADVQDAIDTLAEDGHIALVVINAQHNPTGRNWPEPFVRALVRRAFQIGATPLIDDAYYGVHTPDTRPTSALRIVLEEASGSAPWLAVRSFGKQFRCNGWQIGAMTGPAETLAQLTRSMFDQGFPSGADRQLAIADYLADPKRTAELQALNAGIANNRDQLYRTLRAAGWPDNLLHPAEATPYALIARPPEYADTDRFRADVAARTGIALAPANIERPPGTGDLPYARMYLGAPEFVIADALNRMTEARIHY